MSDELRIIKKYPNRRLYDTVISSYITLEDVKQLVIKEVPIQVIDARTKEDLTYNILLQIIIESEEKGPSFFSTDVLQKMIRLYGGSMQETFRMMLEQWGKIMSQPSSSANPVQGALHHWQNLQQEWLDNWATQMGIKPKEKASEDELKKDPPKP